MPQNCSFLAFILLCQLLTASSHSTHFYPHRHHVFSAAEQSRRVAHRLGKPLVDDDDGTIYACSEKYVYAFQSNGTISWAIHLNQTCNLSIPPAYGGKRKIYIVAENRVVRINFLNIKTRDPIIDVFFNPESDDEIVGLSSSMLSSAVYIIIKNHGLFSYSMGSRLLWSAAPVQYQFGYRQGCRKNVTDCYFTSSALLPVVDQCEASIYVSNNYGEVYALSARTGHFKWIQDLSSYDKLLTLTPGNNGLLYVTLPVKALVFALDVLRGDVLWEASIGPLSSVDYAPVVDSNGWISIGSLDGYLYSISPTGMLNKFSKVSPEDCVMQVSPVLDCSGYAIYISQTEIEGKNIVMTGDYSFVTAMKPRNVVVFSLLVPATGSTYWSETYPGASLSFLSGSDLHNFILDEGLTLAFITAKRIGNPIPCRNTDQKVASSCSQVKSKALSVYTGNERAILVFLLFETTFLVILAIVVRFCWIFWGKQKLQDRGLGQFLEKRRSLRLKKKVFDRTITELEQKAREEATSHDIQEKLDDLVREREGIKKKLSSTYSLGRDRNKTTTKLLRSKSLLPLYGGKTTRFYSFKGLGNESVSVFHTSSDASSSASSEEESSREIAMADNNQHLYDGDDDNDDAKSVAMMKLKGKGKVPDEGWFASDDDDNDDGGGMSTEHSSSTSRSGYSGFVEHFLVGSSTGNEDWRKGISDDGVLETMQVNRSIRRRASSATN